MSLVLRNEPTKFKRQTTSNIPQMLLPHQKFKDVSDATFKKASMANIPVIPLHCNSKQFTNNFPCNHPTQSHPVANIAIETSATIDDGLTPFVTTVD